MDRFQVVLLVLLVAAQLLHTLWKRMHPAPLEEPSEDATATPQAARKTTDTPEIQEASETIATPQAAAFSWNQAPISDKTKEAASKADAASYSWGAERLRTGILAKAILDPPPGMRWFRRG